MRKYIPNLIRKKHPKGNRYINDKSYDIFQFMNNINKTLRISKSDTFPFKKYIND